MKKVSIPTNKGIKVVMMENIIRIEASSNYSRVYFINEYPLTVARLLQWFENNLPGKSFYRIHKGHIVNMRFIESLSDGNKVLLANGEQLQVSKRKKTAFKKMIA